MSQSKRSTPAPEETGFRADLLKAVYGNPEVAVEVPEESSPASGVIYRTDLLKGASVATMTLAMVLAPGAKAEEPAASGDSTSLPEVIVRGESDVPGYHVDSVSLPKYTEPLRDTPQSISVISQQLMQDQGANTLRDALRNVSGISLAAGEGSSQGDNLTIRGFTARSDIFLDGMRDFGSYYRDPFNLQAVEVLEGPSSISFGRGSTGGVINQESKTPNMTQSTSGGVTIGTDRTKRGTIDYNQPLPSTLSGSAFRLNIMGDSNGVAGREGALYRRFGFAPSLVFGLGTSTRLTLSYYHQTEDNTPDYGIPWLLSRPAPVSRSNFYGFKDGNNYLDTSVDIGTIKLEHDFNEHFTLQNQVRYANYFRAAQITEPQIPTTVTAATPLDQIQVTRNQITTESLETQFLEQLNGIAKFETFGIKHAVVAGFEYDHETSDPVRTTWAGVPTTSLLDPNDNQGFRGIGTVSSRTTAKVDTVALFAVDTIKLGEHWEVIGGIRWDDAYSSYVQTVAPATSFNRVDNMVSWRGALVYKPVPAGSIYFSSGTSFNPSAEQLSLSTATANVAPEKNLTYEIGTKWDLLEKRFSMTAALFWDEKTNARTTDPNDPLLNILGGDQRSVGGTIGLVGKLTENWQLTTSYTHMESKVVTSSTPGQEGHPLANAPRNTFSLWTTYKTPWKLEFGAGADVVSGRTASLTPDANTDLIRAVPGYVVFNAMAKYPLSKNVVLQFNLDNIANKYYYDGIHPQHIIPGAGRTFLVSLAFKF